MVKRGGRNCSPFFVFYSEQLSRIIHTFFKGQMHLLWFFIPFWYNSTLITIFAFLKR